MEGLIPMVYKSFKKNKTRRQYEYLSSGAAQTFNVANFCAKDDQHHDYDDDLSRKDQHAADKVSGLHHRRFNSASHFDNYRAGGFALENDAAAAKPKQLVRFRSHRMFSCVTGA